MGCESGRNLVKTRSESGRKGVGATGAGPRLKWLCSSSASFDRIKGRKPTPKNSHPNENNLSEHFCGVVLANCPPFFLSAQREERRKSLSKLFSHTVCSWVYSGGWLLGDSCSLDCRGTTVRPQPLCSGASSEDNLCLLVLLLVCKRCSQVGQNIKSLSLKGPEARLPPSSP